MAEKSLEQKKRDNASKAKYDANNTKKYMLKLNLKTDADIMECLDEVDNKQGYIKQLIRDDMALSPFMRELCRAELSGYRLANISVNDDGHRCATIVRGNERLVIEEEGKESEGGSC